MDFDTLLQLLQSRRSVREFTAEPVSRRDIRRLLEAASWAPSNHNRQGWKFIVLENATEIKTLATAVENALATRLHTLPAIAGPYAKGLLHYATIFAKAPALILALHKWPTAVSAPLLEGLPNPALVSGEAISTAMAVQNLLLAAHTLGLGTCVMTGPLLVPQAFSQIALPTGYDLTCLIAVGHPTEPPSAPRRKGLEQIAEFRNDPADQTTV